MVVGAARKRSTRALLAPPDRLDFSVAGIHLGRMSQLALFQHERRMLFEGAKGQVIYVPGDVAQAKADAWFDVLRDTIAWQKQRRMMYDREVDVPRLTAHFALDDGALPAAFRDAAAVAARVAGARFNSVGLNLYRDGNDSVAAHNDQLDDLVAGAPIALLSLGATRRMTIAAKDKSQRALHIDLEAGSVLLMDYVSQLHLLHGIAKARNVTGARISLAFRQRPRDAVRAGASGHAAEPGTD